MHHPTDKIAHTTAFVTPVVEHWLEREIAQWVLPMKDRSQMNEGCTVLNKGISCQCSMCTVKNKQTNKTRTKTNNQTKTNLKHLPVPVPVIGVR